MRDSCSTGFQPVQRLLGTGWKPVLHAFAVLAFSCAAFAQPTTAPSTAPSTLADESFLTIPGDQWKLSFDDEFDGDALDTTKWSIGLPWHGDDGEGRHHNDQYLSYIMDHNVVVEGGMLKLLTRREDVTAKNGRVFHFTEGLVTTHNSFWQRYGYSEARLKLPVDCGPGLWPAFWTLSDHWPPEMDICEIFTSDLRSHQGFCFRASGSRHEQWDNQMMIGNLPRDWTTYGMEWGPGYQIYNINRKITWRITGDHITADKHYILLNSGVEARHPPTDRTIFPNAFEVDYLRVYSHPDAQQETTRP